MGDPCKNWLPARIGGWPGTATGGQIHVVHISHTHPPKELIQALRKYLLVKKIAANIAVHLIHDDDVDPEEVRVGGEVPEEDADGAVEQRGVLACHGLEADLVPNGTTTPLSLRADAR